MSTSSQSGAGGRGRPATRGTDPGAGTWKGLLCAGGALLLIVGLIAAVNAFGGDEQDTGSRAGADPATTTQGQDEGARELADLLERRDAEDHAALGEEDAPVAMVVFSDYNCPYCGDWAQDIQPELMDRVDSGELRIEWRDYPIITGSSEAVAQAAHAAGLQDRYWQFHDAYFAAGEQFEGQDLEEALEEIVEETGLDAERFHEDRRSDATAGMVERDAAEAQAIGVSSTPAFVVNGRPILGAQPLPVFEQAVEDALQETEG